MKDRTKEYSANYAPLVLVVAVYLLLIIFSWDAPYFWDNVQQTSKEANWYYSNGFSELFLPGFGEHPEIVSTGYHPPLMGMITAALWFLLGKKLWVSHFFIGVVALVLVGQTFSLFKQYLPHKHTLWAGAILLLEPTLLAQIYMASPDVVLLTAFVVSLSAILRQKKYLLMATLPFLILINGRGMLMGGVLFIFSVLHSFCLLKKPNSMRQWLNEMLPFMPAALLILFYYAIYFYSHGWFFSHSDSPWADGWEAHNSLAGFVKNLLAYGLRLFENGRFVIWFAAVFICAKMWRNKQLKSLFKDFNGLLAILVLLIFSLFLYFALSTKLVIGSRYYMPMFFVLYLLLFRWAASLWHEYKVKILTLVTSILFFVGNFWVYPEMVATAWDATLSHTPFYQLKAESIDFLRHEGINFDEVSAGFGISGHQKYYDLTESDLYISNDVSNNYFIYSNVSNLSDDLVSEFNDERKWKKIKHFKKGFVFVTVLKNLQNE